MSFSGREIHLLQWIFQNYELCQLSRTNLRTIYKHSQLSSSGHCNTCSQQQLKTGGAYFISEFKVKTIMSGKQRQQNLGRTVPSHPQSGMKGGGECMQLLSSLSAFYASPRSSIQGIVPSSIKMALSISINISKIITPRRTQRHISEIIQDFFFSISTNLHTKQVPQKLMSWASLSVYLQPLTSNPLLGFLEFS